MVKDSGEKVNGAESDEISEIRHLFVWLLVHPQLRSDANLSHLSRMVRVNAICEAEA
jgi:hypothetical protein